MLVLGSSSSFSLLRSPVSVHLLPIFYDPSLLVFRISLFSNAAFFATLNPSNTRIFQFTIFNAMISSCLTFFAMQNKSVMRHSLLSGRWPSTTPSSSRRTNSMTVRGRVPRGVRPAPRHQVRFPSPKACSSLLEQIRALSVWSPYRLLN